MKRNSQHENQPPHPDGVSRGVAFRGIWTEIRVLGNSHDGRIVPAVPSRTETECTPRYFKFTASNGSGGPEIEDSSENLFIIGLPTPTESLRTTVSNRFCLPFYDVSFGTGDGNGFWSAGPPNLPLPKFLYAQYDAGPETVARTADSPLVVATSAGASNIYSRLFDRSKRNIRMLVNRAIVLLLGDGAALLVLNQNVSVFEFV